MLVVGQLQGLALVPTSWPGSVACLLRLTGGSPILIDARANRILSENPPTNTALRGPAVGPPSEVLSYLPRRHDEDLLVTRDTGLCLATISIIATLAHFATPANTPLVGNLLPPVLLWDSLVRGQAPSPPAPPSPTARIVSIGLFSHFSSRERILLRKGLT